MKSVEQALSLMKEKGFKNTPKRQAMLEIIAREGKFVTARQVQEQLNQTYPSISYDTVYRNLYTFVEQGILEMSERHGEKVFLMHCYDHGHHHHFICDNCGQITELKTCPMDIFEKQLPNYVFLGHKFEITGLCPHCAKDVAPVEKPHTSGCSCGHH